MTVYFPLDPNDMEDGDLLFCIRCGSIVGLPEKHDEVCPKGVS
jgi:hypothetical protein